MFYNKKNYRSLTVKTRDTENYFSFSPRHVKHGKLEK